MLENCSHLGGCPLPVPATPQPLPCQLINCGLGREGSSPQVSLSPTPKGASTPWHTLPSFRAEPRARETWAAIGPLGHGLARPSAATHTHPGYRAGKSQVLGTLRAEALVCGGQSSCFRHEATMDHSQEVEWHPSQYRNPKAWRAVTREGT